MMTLKWIFLMLLHYERVLITSPSITGVTYMDNFDFEERYRDVNECNPFHWHPLHMPETCAYMFESLIRSKIASKGPARIMRERQLDELGQIYPLNFGQDYTRPKKIRNFDYEDYISSSEYETKQSAPYDKMLKLLKKDIKKDPSTPKLGVHPHLGPVAIYDQEISRRSEDVIKELATAYAKYGQESYANFIGYNDSPDHNVYYWDSDKNRTESQNSKKDMNKKKDRITRTETKLGGVVTIVETLKPRKRRSVLFILN